MIWIIMEIEKGVIHWTDNILLFIYLFIFWLKHFLRLHTKYKLRKRKTHTHTYIAQIEEYKATQSCYSNTVSM